MKTVKIFSYNCSFDEQKALDQTVLSVKTLLELSPLCILIKKSCDFFFIKYVKARRKKIDNLQN